MKSLEYSSVDAKTGSVIWNGPLSVEKGNHSNMPSRDASYLPGDERGHVNASSLNGSNTNSNVVAQHADVNHGAYYSMEQGERSALQNGATIDSTKTAVVSQPGERPNSFVVTDNVTYSDGHAEAINHSFANESYAIQGAWNDTSSALSDTFDDTNPGDCLRESMTAESYAELMEETDATLPGISDDYAPADFSGISDSGNTSGVSLTEADIGNVGGDADFGANAGDSSADASPDAD